MCKLENWPLSFSGVTARQRLKATRAPQRARRTESGPTPSPSAGVRYQAYVYHSTSVRNMPMSLLRAQWLRGRALDSRLREPGFESCAAVLKP